MALSSISSGGKVTVRTLTLGSRHLAQRTSDMTQPDQNNFYVTLMSTVSRDIYDLKTHADFTVKLAQPIDLGSTSKWEVGVSEISCSSSPEGANPVLLYCNLISPQFPGDSTVRCIRTFRLYVSARVSERAIRASGAAQISGHSNGVPDDRRSAYPLWGQRYAYESGASFSQELPVVDLYKTRRRHP